MVGNTSFTFRLVGTMGCEIVGPEGVVAWTVDPAWAAVIVGLLDRVEEGDLVLPAARHGDADGSGLERSRISAVTAGKSVNSPLSARQFTKMFPTSLLH